MPLTFRTGDLFDSCEQAIVNTVNCYGVMGKGIALEFKRRYPQMFRDYVERCKLPTGHARKVAVGRPYLFEETGRLILNFPTKNHWRFPSKVSYIADGLAYFAEHHEHWGVSSIAFPRLGCENGGLDWETQVLPVMREYLDPLTIPVAIVTWDGVAASATTAPVMTSFATGQLGLPGLEQSSVPATSARRRRSKAHGSATRSASSRR